MKIQTIAGTLAGLRYGYAANRRGRLVDAILAHATSNASIAAYVLTNGVWSLVLNRQLIIMRIREGPAPTVACSRY